MLPAVPRMPCLVDLPYHGLFLRIPEISFSSLETRHERTLLSTHYLPDKLWGFTADSPASPRPVLALPCSDACCSSQKPSTPSKAGFASRLSAAFENLSLFTEKETEVQSGPIITQLVRQNLSPRLCTLGPVPWRRKTRREFGAGKTI